MIVVGVDVDIMLWDLECCVCIINDVLYYVVDYMLYEGIEVMGWLVYCFLCGEMLVENGKYFELVFGWG